jgi:hypothetical protein
VAYGGKKPSLSYTDYSGDQRFTRQRPHSFEPGELILVRDEDDTKWYLRFFTKYNPSDNYPFYCNTHRGRAKDGVTGKTWRFAEKLACLNYTLDVKTV